MTKNRRAKQDARRLADASGMSYIQALRESQLNAVLHGIPTPLPTLSGYLNGGWQPGQLITIAARPNRGKLIFASNAVLSALDAKKSVLYFSLELSADEALARVAQLQKGVSPSESNGSYFRVDADYALTLEGIIDRATRAKSSPNGLDLILIDSLQLIAPPSGFSSRAEAISSITRELKTLAHELKTPVILFSQLNRGGGLSLKDLGSSSVAHDSDVVILLDREDYRSGALSIMLEKNRVGESGKTIYGYIDSKTQKIRDLAVERSSRTNPILRGWAEDLFQVSSPCLCSSLAGQ